MKDDRTRQIENLRNRAVLEALESALRLADPACDTVRIWPFNTEAEEKARREALRPYVMLYVVGPLVDALRNTNLPEYGHVVHTPYAEQHMNQLDDSDTVQQLLRHWAEQ